MTRTMMLALSLLYLGLFGCASPLRASIAGEPSWNCERPQIDDEWIESAAAVQLVASDASHCQAGAFKLVVRSVGLNDNVLYLNSESDYRARNNLAIALLPRAQEELRQKLGELSLVSLQDQELLVVGVARRVPIHIWIGSRLRPRVDVGGVLFPPDVDVAQLNTTYNQTHVLVESASQLWLLRPSISAK